MQPEIRFHTATGRRSLNLIATLGSRHEDAFERLPTLERLIDWFETVDGTRLSQPPDEPALRQVRAFRDSLARVMDAAHRDETPAQSDIEAVNRTASLRSPPPLLLQDGRTASLEEGRTVDAVLGEIARDAIELLTGPEFDRVKLCAADDCSVLFVDSSRPGRRRWCSMEHCGNRAKKRTYNARSK